MCMCMHHAYERIATPGSKRPEHQAAGLARARGVGVGVGVGVGGGKLGNVAVYLKADDEAQRRAGMAWGQAEALCAADVV